MNRYKRKNWCEWQDFPVYYINEILVQENKYLSLIIPEHICYKMKETSPTLSMTTTYDQIGNFTTVYEINTFSI